jgi:hypothetical protein
MSDGPFRNAPLSSRWKTYGKKLTSDATTVEERKAQACHSMMGDVGMDFHPLFSELKARAKHAQMDLDPVAAIEPIFNKYPGLLLADALQRHLVANLRDQIPPEQALDRGLNSTVNEWLDTLGNRLHEQCISARDRGDMNEADYRKAIARNRETFSAIKPDEICTALASGNKRALHQAIKKKIDIDEGPEE